MASQHKTMLERLSIASPYNIFYNTIASVPKQDNTISFADLLCPSLGQVKESLQITFRVDIKWLMRHYEQRHLSTKPLTILYGDENPKMVSHIENNLPNVKHYCVPVRDLYGSHHAKLAIFVYEDDSLRVAFLTANLYQDHWEHFNHWYVHAIYEQAFMVNFSFWVSPPCRPLTHETHGGESPTDFKSDLIFYLQRYNVPSILDTWVDYVRRADFSDVRVFLVTSFPGLHPIEQPLSHLQQMENLLSKHCNQECETWSTVIQTSCIGLYGPNVNNWLTVSLSRSLHASADSIRIVYPSVSNVEWGLFTQESLSCVGYTKSFHDQQKWLMRYLYQWKADKLGRSDIMCSCKSYCCVSPCGTKVAWFLLTSANATRGGWGQRRNNRIYVRNYELGVLFIPSFFKEEYFRPQDDNNNFTAFPLMYDLPLTKYNYWDDPCTFEERKKITQKFAFMLDTYEAN